MALKKKKSKGKVIVEKIKAKKKSTIFGVLVAIAIIIGIVMGVGNFSEGPSNTENVSQNLTNNITIPEYSVVFFHANWCPHCQAMKPLVSDLIKEGYPVVKAEVSTEKGKLIEEKYPTVQSVPTFICYGTNKIIVGEQTKSALIDFINSCSKAKQ